MVSLFVILAMMLYLLPGFFNIQVAKEKQSGASWLDALGPKASPLSHWKLACLRFSVVATDEKSL